MSPPTKPILGPELTLTAVEPYHNVKAARTKQSQIL